MKAICMGLACAAALMMPCAPALAQAAPCPYTVTKFGSPICPFWGAMSVFPRALNNLGSWAGWASSCSLGHDRAIWWTPATGLQDLPVPAGTTGCQAYGINDQGLVVGWRSGISNGQQHGSWACIWNGANFIEIPPIGTTASSGAMAVNNSSVVVGYRDFVDADGTNTREGFVWQGGVITEIDPGTEGFSWIEPTDISESSIVAGKISAGSEDSKRGFRWQSGALEILSPLPGAVSSTARGVSDEGVAVGASEEYFPKSSLSFARPTVWNAAGQATELPLLPGYLGGSCMGIAHSNLIFGFVNQPSQPGLPSSQDVVWIYGEPFSISLSIQNANQAQYGMAYAINSLGQIIASGFVAPSGVPSGTGAWILTQHHLQADLNNDCEVDGIDLAIVLQQWGSATSSNADLDQDGAVDGADLGVLLGAWTMQ